MSLPGRLGWERSRQRREYTKHGCGIQCKNEVGHSEGTGKPVMGPSNKIQTNKRLQVWLLDGSTYFKAREGT